MNFGPMEILIVLAIVLLLFGATALPKLARSVGQAQKEFKKGLEEGASSDTSKSEATSEAKSDKKSDKKSGANADEK